MSQTFPIKVTQTNNKHSRAVFKDGNIVIRLARRLSAKQKEAHIKNLTDRLTKQLIKRQATTQLIDPFREVMESGSGLVTLSSGLQYQFKILKGPNRTTQNDNRITVQYENNQSLHRLLWKALSLAEIEAITALTTQINSRTIKAKFEAVRLRVAKSRWGSCSTSGNLMLNAALLFVEPEVFEYVIIHELAHRVHANHSKKFWQLVELHCPNYKEYRLKLKTYELPLLN